MKTIYSPQDIPILVDDEDFEMLSIHKWNVYDRYAETNIDGKTIKMHRLLLGISDKSFHCDHKNGVTTDNRKDNLRICNRFQNMQNRKINANNTSGAKGIDILSNGRYRVRVEAFGVRTHVGVYKTLEEAKDARAEFAKQKHGEFYQ